MNSKLCEYICDSWETSLKIRKKKRMSRDMTRAHFTDLVQASY